MKPLCRAFRSMTSRAKFARVLRGVHAKRAAATLATVLCATALLNAPLMRDAQAAGDNPPTATDTRPAIVIRGEYLARAGDCVACHTAPRGKMFGGGLAMETPFGTLYSPNISPDVQYGIGTWSADAFFNMMRTGKSPDGKLIYPAMPIAAYTKVTREDSDAIFAYLKSVPPVHQPNRPQDLRFPFNHRDLLLGWRSLYFREGEFKPNPAQSAEWNRGAYLVEGLGHCSMCHTKINMLGGSSRDKQFAGGLIPVQNWYAPSLTSDKDGGLGDWSIKDIVDLLQAGISDRGAVYGPMAEVTYHSLQYLSDADVKAMAVYLKTLPDNDPGRKSGPTARTDTPVFAAGARIYADKCASCHGAKGEGQPQHYPPLAGNQSIEMDSAVNPIRIVLNGGFPPGTRRNPEPYGMPPFAQELNDVDAAAVVTYIRTAWGNHGLPVTAKQVNELRNAPLH
jgi:mono/diheme cytochrome c family protein